MNNTELNRKLVSQYSELVLSEGYRLKMPMNGYSMFPVIRPGDIGLIDHFPFNELKPGNVIVFRNSERLVAHRVIRIIENSEGNYIKCKGDATFRSDPLITQNEYIGRITEITRGNKKLDLSSDNQRILSSIIAFFSPFLPPFYRTARFFYKLLIRK